MGLMGALATASRSLEVFTAGISVAGQNISNANTPGYIREELLLDPAHPYQSGQLVVGTGVVATGIVQQIDRFLETRIHTANSDFTASAAKNAIYKQLEEEIRELGDGDLSTGLNDFLAAIQNLSTQPESLAFRQLAVGQGTQFAGQVAALRSSIDELRQTQTIKVDDLVAEANELIDKIADLNPKISKLEASGLYNSDAGALRSQRYTAMNRLSEIIPTRFVERKDGAVDIFSGSDYVILTGQVQHLEVKSSYDRGVQVGDVQLSITQSPIAASGGGELAGVIEGRDTILGGFVDDLDTYVSNMIFEFNKIHASGQGLVGFTTATSDVRITDATAALNTAASGLKFTPTHGSFQLQVTNTLSDATVTTGIPIDLDGIGTDTTLNSLQAALDAVANVSASITTDGRLQITADSNFEISFSDDTSGALAALGINTFFTGSDSGDIGVNAVVQNDHRFFAVSNGGGPSDGSNAVEMLDFINKPLAVLGSDNLDRFYDVIVNSVSQQSASEEAIAEGLSAFRDSLNNQRAQYSGVSLDEEAVQVLEFQRSFQAAARLVSTIDELFTILLTM